MQKIHMNTSYVFVYLIYSSVTHTYNHTVGVTNILRFLLFR